MIAGTGLRDRPLWRVASSHDQHCYYTLIDGPDAHIGDVHVQDYGEDDLRVVRDARALPLSWWQAEGWLYSLADMVHSDFRTGRLEPLGPVRPYFSAEKEITGGTHVACPDGWRIAEILPLAALLGPQGSHAVAAVRMLADMTDARLCGALRTFADNSADIDTEITCSRTAVAALGAVGADTRWCEFISEDSVGATLLALLARDRIGTVEGWDQAAYDTLATPYQVAFDKPLHPGDADPGLGRLITPIANERRRCL